MNKNRFLLIVTAAILICTFSIGSAMAYFTDYAQTNGAVGVVAGTKTVLTEDVDPGAGSFVKHVSVKNTGTAPCFIRAKVFYPSDLTVSVSGWTAGAEDYYYYGSPVEPGDSAAGLDVTVSGFPTDDTNLQPDISKLNVVVVYECVPVRYDENGQPVEKWDQKIEASSTTSG